jgi:hypothetical protein
MGWASIMSGLPAMRGKGICAGRARACSKNMDTDHTGCNRLSATTADSPPMRASNATMSGHC